MPQVLICNVPKLEAFYLPPSLPILKGGCNLLGINSLAVDLNIDFVNTCVAGNIDYHEKMTGVTEHSIADAEFKELVHGLISKWAIDLTEQNPTLIAISVFSAASQYFARELCIAIKKINPAVKIIIGGQGIVDSSTTEPRFAIELQQQSIIDLYIEGDAETAWPKFLAKFFNLDIVDSDISTGNYLNISYLPDFSDFDIADYEKHRTTDGFLYFPVTGSRGCVQKCTFCEVPSTWKFIQKNADNVRKEIASAITVADKLHVHFTDSLVNGSLKEFNLILDNLIELQDVNKFNWGGQYIIRPGQVEDWAKIAKSGCRLLEVGMETGSDSLRYEMDKRFKNEDLIYALEMMKQHDISCVLLMFCGYPTETAEQFEETLEFFKLIQPYADSSVRAVQLNWSFCVYKDTPLYNNREVIKLHISSDPAQWICQTNPNLNFKERIRRRLVTQEHLEDLGFRMASDVKEALLGLVPNYMKYKRGKHYTFDEMALEVLGRPTTITRRYQSHNE
jgi:radical SAM superfamily enzyme YgiQ (UPF0313 family)